MPVSQRPDPAGTVSLQGTGVTSGELVLAEQSNTFIPGWNAIFTRQPIADDARLIITLADEDVVLDDSIGTVTIDSGVLRGVAAVGQAAGVPVSHQGQHQIAFVVLTVRPAR